MKRARKSGAIVARPDTRAAVTWRAAAIACAVVLTYWNSLSGPFFFDDFRSIVYNTHIREWWQLRDVLFPAGRATVAGRPLVSLSLAINYALGGLDVRIYHASNILFHVLSGLLILGIVRRTLELPALRSTFGSAATQLAFASALIWALHPLNSEVVDYVIQRTESMMALFCLFTLYASIRSLGAGRSAWWTSAAIVACALGMACKESMAVTPLLVMLYDRIYIFDRAKDAFNRRWRFYAGLSATWLVMIGLVSSGARSNTAGFSNDLGVGPWTYLLNQTIVITEYLRRVVWPESLIVNYGFPRTLSVADVAPRALFLTLLLMATVIALVKRPKVGFLGAWFFITLAPTSSVIPIATEVGAERRMYLPLAALAVLGVVAAFFAWRSLLRRKSWSEASNVLRAQHAPAAVLLLLSIAFGARTVIRNRDYSSTLRLFRTAVEGWPTANTHYLLGQTLTTGGAHDEGIAHLRVATAAVPKAHYDLGLELIQKGELEEGLTHLKTLIDIAESPPASHPIWDPPTPSDVMTAREILGWALAKNNQWAEAAEQSRLILAAEPKNPEGQHLLGDALFAQQRFAEAVTPYRSYLESNPRDVDALNHLGIALATAGMIDDAISTFRRAVSTTDGGNAWAERNLANALLDRGDTAEAAIHASKAIALNPEDPAAHDVFGRALAARGQFDKAIEQFTRALQIDPAYRDAREHLGQIRQIRRQ